MEVSIGSRIKHAWNAFLNRDPTGFYRDIGVGYSYRPDRPRLTRGNERSIVTSVYNRIALDCASINIQHVRLDDSERFLEKIPSGLNDCLNLSANIDQTGRAFLQDVVLSMLDEGCVAIIPVDTDDDPDTTGSYKIESMRTGKILEWFPSHIKVRVYNERTGLKEDIVVPKDTVAIIENPLYAVINEPNSTMQRLIRKLNLLDVVDEQSSSGKLDLIIQLPYVIKTEARRQQAEKRRVEIERQLAGSKYAQMNETNITTGGYVGSKMYTENMAQAKTLASSAFGNLILTHREYLTNAVTEGYPSAGAWFDSTLELPNEIMMYGSLVYTPAGDGKIVVNRYTTGKTQLALFTVVPKLISNRATFWLRDVVSSAHFALVGYDGYPTYHPASHSYGVRPVFAIG